MVDVAVGGADHFPDLGQGAVELLAVHVGAQCRKEVRDRSQQVFVVGRKRLRLGHLTLAVLGNHRQHALGQIAELVGQVVVHAPDHGLVREVAVIAEGDFAQQEVAHLVETVLLDQLSGHDHVAQGLGDLLALVGPPAVGVDPLGRCDAGGHQKGRPVDGVEAQDILADHVNIGRPEGCEVFR